MWRITASTASACLIKDSFLLNSFRSAQASFLVGIRAFTAYLNDGNGYGARPGFAVSRVSNIARFRGPLQIRYDSFGFNCNCLVSKIERRIDELFPRVGFIVTDSYLDACRVITIYNGRAEIENRIKEGKNRLKLRGWRCVLKPENRSYEDISCMPDEGNRMVFYRLHGQNKSFQGKNPISTSSHGFMAQKLLHYSGLYSKALSGECALIEGSNMITVAIVTRRLKDGKTYEDFRKAWFHTVGFGSSSKLFTLISATDAREITVIGFVETELAELRS